jgi:hypothetical protein
MRRTGTIVVLAILASALLSTGTMSAATSPRIPHNAAEWATFTPAQRQAALAYEKARFEAVLAAGKTEFKVALGNDLASGFSITATGSASCGFQFYTSGPSRYVSGGGSTSASELMDLIYASKSTKQGQFLRGGVLKDNWYHSITDSAYVEGWTDYWDHSWTWEHPTYKSNGWHGALNGSTWVVGPEQPCSYTWTP